MVTFSAANVDILGSRSLCRSKPPAASHAVLVLYRQFSRAGLHGRITVFGSTTPPGHVCLTELTCVRPHPHAFVAVGRTDADLALSFDVASNPEGPRNIDVSPSVVVEIAQVITRVPGAIASLLVWVRVIYLGTECVAEIVPVVSVKRSA